MNVMQANLILQFCKTPRKSSEIEKHGYFNKGSLYHATKHLLENGNLEKIEVPRGKKISYLFSTIDENYIQLKLEKKGQIKVYNFVPYKENQTVIEHKIPPHLAHCVTKNNESNQIHNVSERSRNKVYVSGTTLNNF